MSRIKIHYFICISFLLNITCFNQTVFAENESFQISVEALLPDNQLDKNANYFDLKMEPGTKQTVSIQLTNHTSKKMKLKVVYSDAKTTSQGVIEYIENKKLKSNIPDNYKFTQIIDGPTEVILKKNETKKVDFDVQMPEDKFDGYIAGGIEFIEQANQKENSDSLKMRRSYLMGFRARETDTQLPDVLTLGQTNIKTKGYKKAVIVPLNNENGNYVEGLNVTTQIRKKNSSVLLSEIKKSSMRMAPYSVLEYSMFLEDMMLDVGDYEIIVNAESKNGFNQEWKQEFQVTKEDTEYIKENDNSFAKEFIYTPFWIILTIVLGTIIATIIYVVYVQKIKKEKKRK